MSAIRGVAVVLPAWEYQGVRVEGADEDAFTLLARAGELLARSSVARPSAGLKVYVLAELPEALAPALLEAWGLEGSVEVHPPHELTAYQHLSALLEEGGGSGERWLLAAEVTSGHRGDPHEAPGLSSLAVGLKFQSGPGLTAPRKTGAQLPDGADAKVVAETYVRAFARWGPPEAGRWSHALRTGKAPDPGPELWGSLGGLPEEGPHTVSPHLLFNPDSPLPPLLALASAAHALGLGGRGLWLHATEHFVSARELEVTGEVTTAGLEEDSSPPLLVAEPAWVARRSVDLRQVSEGAHVSRQRYLATRPARWRLEGDRCDACGVWTLPAQGSCRRCGQSEGLRPGRLSRRTGVVEASTVIRSGAQPTEFDALERCTGPYTVALVRFPEGARLTFPVTDQSPATTVPGATVELVLRRLYPQEGEWRYGLKAVTLPGPPSPLPEVVVPDLPAAPPAAVSPAAAAKARPRGGPRRKPVPPPPV